MRTWPSAFAALLVVACAHDALEPSSPPGASDAPAAPQEFMVRAPSGPPRCDAPGAGVCGCTDVPTVEGAPNLYFVLDRSGSMAKSDEWEATRDVTAGLVRVISARAWFGATLFPTGADCAPGAEVMPLTRGGADAAATFGRATSGGAVGGSPIAATLRALAPTLAASSRRTYVVLFTDGGADCGSAVACDTAKCVLNIESLEGCSPTGPNCCNIYAGSTSDCLDDVGAVDAVAELHAVGVDTFVVGISKDGPYAPTLSAMAKAGAAGPLFKLGDPSLLAALTKVSGTLLASCTVPLKATVSDPRLIDVYVDEQRVPRDAWTTSGTSLTLLGATCDRVLSGGALDVRVVEQCPSPAIK